MTDVVVWRVILSRVDFAKKGFSLLSLIYFLILFSVSFSTFSDNASGTVMSRKNLYQKLEHIDQTHNWNMLQATTTTLSLYRLPFFLDKKTLYRLTNPGEKKIGTSALSPDGKRVAFAIYFIPETSLKPQKVELYLLDCDSRDAAKLLQVPANDVISFLGRTQLLLDGYLVNGSQYLFILDLEKDEINVLHELGPSTLGMDYATTSAGGDLVVYDAGDGFVVYDVKTKTTRKLNVKGTEPILSPSGKWILFRRGFSGDYSLVSPNGKDEMLLLPEKRIRSLVRGAGDYRDLAFLSWSPDSHFILFGEASDVDKGRRYVLEIDTKETVELGK